LVAASCVPVAAVIVVVVMILGGFIAATVMEARRGFSANNWRSSI
jgi:hypothetical protein